MKYKQRVIKIKTGFAIAIPPDICKSKGLKKGDEIELYLKPNGKIEINFMNVQKEKLCTVCGENEGKYTCTVCGRFACSNCFWEMGGLCHLCMKK